jgi:hypothetical protein
MPAGVGTDEEEVFDLASGIFISRSDHFSRLVDCRNFDIMLGIRKKNIDDKVIQGSQMK